MGTYPWVVYVRKNTKNLNRSKYTSSGDLNVSTSSTENKNILKYIKIKI